MTMEHLRTCEETSKQREQRLARRREQQRELRAQETPEQRKQRLARQRAATAEETPESRGSRGWLGKEQPELKKHQRAEEAEADEAKGAVQRTLNQKQS